MKIFSKFNIFVLLLVSCGVFDSSNTTDTVLKVYACNQSSGYISVVDMISMEPIDTVYSNLSMNMIDDSDTNMCEQYSNVSSCSDNGCMWMGSYCMAYTTEDPHHIVIDEKNSLWFNTTIMSGFVGMYSLDSNDLIASVEIGDQPALMAINPLNNKLYVSRMMPMIMDNGMSMGTDNSSIQEISYSDNSIETTNIFQIGSPSPHAIAVSSDGEFVYTVSNTADWIYKIDTRDGSYESISMEGVSSIPSIETNILKPIFCTLADNKYLFVTCQAGQYTTGSAINYKDSRVQMWDVDRLELIDEYTFTSNSSAWHIIADEDKAKLYLALSGEPGGSGIDAGVASLLYSDEGLTLDWINNDYSFSLPHGIDYNSEGIVVSDRGTGKLYKISPNNGEVLAEVKVDSRFTTGIATMSYEVDRSTLSSSNDESNENHHHHH